MAPPRILIFDTHPIQYRAPVFRQLSERLPGLEVVFFDESFDGRRWWFQEFGKIPTQNWNLELRSGYPSRALGTSRMAPWRAAARLWSLIAETRPEAVLLYGWYLPEHWAVWAAARWFRVPVVFVGETYSLGSSPARRALKRFLHPLFFSGIREIVSIGAKTAGFYRSLGITPEKVTEAKYCVDTSFFQLSPELKAETRSRLRESMGIGEQDLVILFVGRLFERKRPADMIDLHRRLRGHSRPTHTVIVGNGPLEETLRRDAATESQIHFAGFCDQRSTRDWYHAADLLVVPSEIETWGLVANEAMAAGCPVAVTDTCGTAHDLVLSDETGFVFPVGRMDKLAEWIRRTDSATGRLGRVGEAAKARVTTRFHVGQFADALAIAFGKAITA